MLYFLLVFLVLAGGFFAATETAYSYCNRTRIKIRVEDGDKKAKKIQFVLDNFDSAIITVLIGTNIAHIVASTLATVLAIQLFGEIGTLVATISMTLIVYIFSDTIPKNIAKVNADKVAEVTAIPIIGLMYVFLPFAWLLNVPFRWLMNKFGKKKEEPDITEEDLQTIVETIEEEGVLDEDESSLIQSAIEFDDIAVRSVYTPVEDLVAIDISMGREKIMEVILKEHQFSRLPVYRGSINNIIGVIPIRKAMKELITKPDLRISSMMTKPYFVKPSEKLDDILEGFAKHKTHIAIVVHNNKTLGIITMDDVLDELIGDMLEVDNTQKEVSNNGIN